MAKKATVKRKKYVAELFEKANMSRGASDDGLVGSVSSPHRLDQVSLWLIPLIADTEEEMEELLAAHNKAFGDEADFGTLMAELYEFTDFLEEDADLLVDIEYLEENEEAWLRGLIWDSEPVRTLRHQGYLASGPLYTQRAVPEMLSTDFVANLVPTKGGPQALPFSESHKLLLHPEDYGWPRDVPGRFTPMIFRLAGLCNFTTEHITVEREDAKVIGEHIAGRIDPLLRLIEMKHSHVKMDEKTVKLFPQELRKWAKKNIRWVSEFDELDILCVLVDLLIKSKLITTDPRCGALLLTFNASEALVRPEKYAELFKHVIPTAQSIPDQPIALLDSLISYLGGPVVAEALHLKPQELGQAMKGFSLDIGDRNFTTMKHNYIARCIFGIQHAKFKDYAIEGQLSDTGKLFMRYALAQTLENQVNLWLRMRGQRHAS